MRDTYIPKYHLETIAELGLRINRSRATLSAMRDPKDDRFDPTFPKPIPMGPPGNPYASIRFDASEVDCWIESRKEMRPSITKTERCTTWTACERDETPYAPPTGVP